MIGLGVVVVLGFIVVNNISSKLSSNPPKAPLVPKFALNKVDIKCIILTSDFFWKTWVSKIFDVQTNINLLTFYPIIALTKL